MVLYAASVCVYMILKIFWLQCEVNSLREYFAPFGDVIEVQIPCLENGKKRGFGIVQFASVANAAAALKQLNATVLLGMSAGFIASAKYLLLHSAAM